MKTKTLLILIAVLFMYGVGLKTIYEKAWYGSGWFQPIRAVFLWDRGNENDEILVLTKDQTYFHKFVYTNGMWVKETEGDIAIPSIEEPETY